MPGNVFDCHSLGEGCYWRLVDRIQGCCSTSLSAEDSPHPREWSGPTCHSREASACAVCRAVPQSASSRGPVCWISAVRGHFLSLFQAQGRCQGPRRGMRSDALETSDLEGSRKAPPSHSARGSAGGRPDPGRLPLNSELSVRRAQEGSG